MDESKSTPTTSTTSTTNEIQVNTTENSEREFLDHEPSNSEKIEMRKAVKPPSQWLRLLCKEWAAVNENLTLSTDSKLLAYKPYSKGLLSAQLLCGLSMPPGKETTTSNMTSSSDPDFWEVLGITDSFDRCYIVAQIERFSFLYSVRGGSLEDVYGNYGLRLGTQNAVKSEVDSPNAIGVTDKGYCAPPQNENVTRRCKTEINSEQDRKSNNRRKSSKNVKDSFVTIKTLDKATIRVTKQAIRELTKEQREKHKQEIREQRAKFAQQQKAAALRRAAELVASNRVPIEITRGTGTVKYIPVAHPKLEQEDPDKKVKSQIMVTTAGDLHQIVTHANNLWAKYNAVAQEHNQRVHWVTVSKELGIHVKVREKYARMHARAQRKGFDFIKNAHLKIKDYPEIFFDPSRVPAHLLNRDSLTSTVHLNDSIDQATSVSESTNTTQPVPLLSSSVPTEMDSNTSNSVAQVSPSKESPNPTTDASVKDATSGDTFTSVSTNDQISDQLVETFVIPMEITNTGNDVVQSFDPSEPIVQMSTTVSSNEIEQNNMLTTYSDTTMTTSSTIVEQEPMEIEAISHNITHLAPEQTSHNTLELSEQLSLKTDVFSLPSNDQFVTIQTTMSDGTIIVSDVTGMESLSV